VRPSTFSATQSIGYVQTFIGECLVGPLFQEVPQSKNQDGDPGDTNHATGDCANVSNTCGRNGQSRRGRDGQTGCGSDG
jgi:hypothetical protein